MKNNLLFGILMFPLICNAQVGVNTPTPQKTLHVNGSLQVTNEINVGGTASAAGSAGTSGQILVSGGAGAAPAWQTLNTVSGTISNAYYVQGTTTATATQGQTIDVPGVTITLTVPAGKTQTFMFNITGYMVGTNLSSQGAFELHQNNVKISSAFVSMVSSRDPGLINLPVPTTFLKSVTLGEGTYTFTVKYSSWGNQGGGGTQFVNYNPTGYLGYSGDTEAMLTKMQVLVYNN
ncbi:hypothetical protein ODZ84_07580 [Chryseobacterium fluminis]|uniref:hypothetical protein n=1 Tax=Chryseobacterium fluminis TaxID=2983606 RepID=UPI0022584830|nr:hypothetical protein [Chryseobacterium sp. MMS21-Ot14]UZT99414.1 hypothetical protein ODZ84_07580 [Chryseobacterium sp. MMS21-Ot14]